MAIDLKWLKRHEIRKKKKKDSIRLRFNVLSIDYVRVTNCFYDYDL